MNPQNYLKYKISLEVGGGAENSERKNTFQICVRGYGSNAA